MIMKLRKNNTYKYDKVQQHKAWRQSIFIFYLRIQGLYEDKALVYYDEQCKFNLLIFMPDMFVNANDALFDFMRPSFLFSLY